MEHISGLRDEHLELGNVPGLLVAGATLCACTFMASFALLVRPEDLFFESLCLSEVNMLPLSLVVGLERRYCCCSIDQVQETWLRLLLCAEGVGETRTPKGRLMLVCLYAVTEAGGRACLVKDRKVRAVC